MVFGVSREEYFSTLLTRVLAHPCNSHHFCPRKQTRLVANYQLRPINVECEVNIQNRRNKCLKRSLS